MISIGFVPKAFGLGLIFPIPKGSNNNCNFAKIKDFRGIAISPVISKIFEHCLITLSVDILQSSHFQFGFKKDKGCRDALYVLNETVDYLVDRGSTVNFIVEKYPFWVFYHFAQSLVFLGILFLVLTYPFKIPKVYFFTKITNL